MKTSSLTSIVAACLSAGGAMVGYIFLRPKNLGDYLKGQGFTLASAEDEALWKSIYSENEEYFKSLFPNDESSEKGQKIKKYCVEITAKSDYDNGKIEVAKKLCVDSVQTVKGQLVRKGSNVSDLMTLDDEFKTATAVQGNDKFGGLIEATDDSLEKRAEAYKDGCTNSLVAKPKDDLVQNVDNFCHKKPYSNFKEKLEKEGYVRLVDKEIEDQYTKLNVDKLQQNTGSNGLETIGGGPANGVNNLGVKQKPGGVDKNKFIDEYKKYCNTGDRLKLSEKDNYPKKFSEYRAICAKKGDKIEINEN